MFSDAITQFDYNVIKDVVISCCAFLVTVLLIIGTYGLTKYALFKKRKAIEAKAVADAKEVERKAAEDAKRLKETLDLIRTEIESKTANKGATF